MPLDQNQQQELLRLLSSPAFKAGEEEVLRMTDGSVESMLAPEAAIKMAGEKGVRNAFRLLRQITEPRPQKSGTPTLKHTLQRPK